MLTGLFYASQCALGVMGALPSVRECWSVMDLVVWEGALAKVQCLSPRSNDFQHQPSEHPSREYSLVIRYGCFNTCACACRHETVSMVYLRCNLELTGRGPCVVRSQITRGVVLLQSTLRRRCGLDDRVHLMCWEYVPNGATGTAGPLASWRPTAFSGCCLSIDASLSLGDRCYVPQVIHACSY